MKKILVVDDEEDICSMLKEYLQMENYLVYTATDGIAAMQQLECQPDLILLDINMPQMDGYELCERIRARFEQLRWPKHPERLVTSSMGIAGMSVAASVDPLRWIEEADQSLYRAKRSGRNRIVVMDLGGLTTPRLAEAG